MTINPTDYVYEEPPLTPDGRVQFLGPETVKYISPRRVEVMRQHIRPEISQYSQQQPPPYYSSQVYPSVPSAPPIQPQPQMVPVSMPMVQQQYMMPQMAQMMPQQIVMQQPIMTTAGPQMMMTQMAQMANPVQLVSPQPPVQAPPQQQASPAITLCVNQSPQIGGSPGGGVGALVCPKCRKGIIMRKQDRLRKKILMCLAVCCCPLTCCLPLICICCNYVDACGACGKKYGHRGRKNAKTKVNAVKL
ncbi:LITAF domain-containing protein [Caenorhabditis elegans]|uniref:LITAF domain-containing protein n=1 Tax=Caenorhabditis elegans TaxID=6239 RepID=Q95YD9_CAEEL|nr:LITAF domain-containing protein [Caenorhabditis elegans]CCD66233.1 LITAF domain-containing protein [Caenorhabditis elegans]|eukprot:NP_491988.1 Uncharacterized protein CELE_C30F12.4 [Caenorhabditis elegans]